MSSSFIYYFPTTAMEDAKRAFSKYGVEYACPPKIARQFSSAVTLSGPDGKSGVMYQQNPTAQSLKYVPEKQTWKRIPNTEAFVGVWNDNPPKPEDLIRFDATPGSFITLGDGNEWLIPVARFECDNENAGNLAPMIDVDEFGNVIPGGFNPTQAKLNQMAERLALSFIAGFDALVKDNSPHPVFRFDIDDRDPFDILAANYRVSPAEIVLLQLFKWRDNAFKDVVKVFIDSDTFIQIQLKKKASEQNSTDAGATENSPGTDRQ